MNDTDKSMAIEALNRILELEMAGVVRYTHYSLEMRLAEVDKMLRRPGDIGAFQKT